jgi:hypothetical protein
LGSPRTFSARKFRIMCGLTVRKDTVPIAFEPVLVRKPGTTLQDGFPDVLLICSE